jgi:NADH:ubiquinone oxidoreductase subunit 5 (subunit L)/multisubunit Na+/H+ antiporter MnhA subunit
LIPPLLGFFAKQQVLYSATHSGYFFLSIVAILVSVISASYYLQIIKVIHFPSDKYFGQIKKEKVEGHLPLKSTANFNNYLNILYGLKKFPYSIEKSGQTSAVALTNKAILGPLDNIQLNTEDIRYGTEAVILPTNNIVQITNVHSMTISTLTLTILLFMLNPSLILNSSHLMALTIFNS